MTRYRLRAAALADVEQTSDYYQSIRPELAERFELALTEALAHVSLHPATGSPKHTRQVSGATKRNPLRMWLMSHFPYAVFYLVQSEHIEIIRVLHQATNIPKHLKNNNE